MDKAMKLPCIVTGILSYFSKQSMIKKIGKFGSVEEVKKHYICPKARKLLRSGLTVEEVRERLKVTEKLPVVDLNILSRLKLLKKPRRKKKDKIGPYGYYFWNNPEYQKRKRETVAEMERFNTEATPQEYIEWATGGKDGCQVPLGGTCQRPDIFIGNGKYCDGCDYLEFCLCDKKRVTKGYDN
jgi:hypothetical protein